MNLHHFRHIHNVLVEALTHKTGVAYSFWDEEADERHVELIGFNMARWFGEYDVVDHLDDCKTVACLGGHCAIAMGKHPREVEKGEMYLAIHGYLGIDDRQGQILFRPRGSVPWEEITAEAAIKALEIIMETEDIPNDLWAQAIRATTPVSNAIDYERESHELDEAGVP